jgi:hypothetical protein
MPSNNSKLERPVMAPDVTPTQVAKSLTRIAFVASCSMTIIAEAERSMPVISVTFSATSMRRLPPSAEVCMMALSMRFSSGQFSCVAMLPPNYLIRSLTWSQKYCRVLGDGPATEMRHGADRISVIRS